jgi:hypothetical protein
MGAEREQHADESLRLKVLPDAAEFATHFKRNSKEHHAAGKL